MIACTIGEAIRGSQEPENYYLYLYRDGDTIFYVGKSVHPFERLLQHLGKMPPLYLLPDSVGRVILDNQPDSFLWTVELYTPAECRDMVRQQKVASYVFFEYCLAQRIHNGDVVRLAEEAMIKHYHPHLNVMGATYDNPLPERYYRPEEIVNAGIIVPQFPEEEK